MNSEVFITKKDNELLKEIYPDNYQEMLSKVLNGYPIQYLIGYIDFFGYKINVNEKVLIPRFETELLVEKTIKYAKDFFDSPIDAIDLGTGSGCIAIALKKELPNVSMNAIDVSNEALEVAKANALLNNCPISFSNTDFGNYEGEYDLIVSNPPYIERNANVPDTVKKYEPNIALYADNKGIEYYDKILSESIKHIKSKALIAFEIGYDQALLIEELHKKYLKDSILKIEKDYNNKDRFAFFFINMNK